ncbi:hypothetical protein F9L07_25275 [Pimelobacter simplex]|uniref:Uncharacterized protein n=1 Tax=Nocardioides simplex TaxID=2045 RepID=A0A7J5DSW4_NOCSI|nr:hypothetical protein [Pimelobacter simplex]KAB2807984.1 hypothetical protein F9L07_25275 [Pimelobacter simplex]
MTESTPYERPTATVPLFLGDDLQRIEELRADLYEAAAASVPTTRLLSETEPAGAEELKAKAEAHDAFVREATERARKVVIQALPRRKKRELEAKHPARMVTQKVPDPDAGEGAEREVEVVHADDTKGFNFETMADDLVPLSIAPGQFTSDAARDAFIDDLSDPHFNAVYNAAIRLNTEDGGIPKAEASSLVARIISAISTSPEPSD